MEVSNLVWAATVAFVIAMIGVDLLAHRRPHEVSLRESAWSSLAWTLLGLAFTAVVWMISDTTHAGEYFTGYLLERALSIDNVFVFVVILGYFAVPPALQHRALLWGVVGALVLRAVFIFIGAALLDRFAWTLAIFGLILIVTAVKLFTAGDDEDVHPEKNVALKLLRRIMPVTHEFEGHKLITREPGSARRAATPLLAVLAVIGTTDVVFAVDSIPAVYGVTSVPFIVFAANAFSLLGLRSLSVLLAGVIDRFVYLKPALALVLLLVGLKMLADYFFGFHPPVWVPLVAIVAILGTGTLLSLMRTHSDEEAKELKEHTKNVSGEQL